MAFSSRLWYNTVGAAQAAPTAFPLAVYSVTVK